MRDGCGPVTGYRAWVSLGQPGRSLRIPRHGVRRDPGPRYDAGAGLRVSFSPDPRLAGRLLRAAVPLARSGLRSSPGRPPGSGPGSWPGLRSGSWPGLRSGSWPGLRSGSWPGLRSGSWPGLRCRVLARVPVRVLARVPVRVPTVGHAAVGLRADRSPRQAAPGELELALALRTPGRVERPAPPATAACQLRPRYEPWRPRPQAGSIPCPGQARRPQGRVRSVTQPDGTGAAEALGSRPARRHCGRACCASWTTPRRWKSGRSYGPQLRSSAARHRRWSWVGSR